MPVVFYSVWKCFSRESMKMIVLEKRGIRFAVVDRRSRNFLGLTEKIRRLSTLFPKTPLVIVFPEVSTTTGHKRFETKEWIRSVQPMLNRHGNAFVFFSVMESVGSGKGLSNTGYLVAPYAFNDNPQKPVQWKAYSKLSFSDFDARLHAFYGAEAKDIQHVGKRTSRLATAIPSVSPKLQDTWLGATFRFPRVKIGGKTVELRVCSDVVALNRSKADVLVIPAAGFPLPLQAEDKESLRKSLAKNGFAVINDHFVRGSRPRLIQLRKNRKTVRIRPIRPKRR